jgi:hypothetical protein
MTLYSAVKRRGIKMKYILTDERHLRQLFVVEESGLIIKTPFTFLSFDGYGLPAEVDEEEEYNRKKQGVRNIRRRRKRSGWLCSAGYAL